MLSGPCFPIGADDDGRRVCWEHRCQVRCAVAGTRVAGSAGGGAAMIGHSVERAIQIVRELLTRYGPPVYVRQQIVHNVHVLAELRELGAVFVSELDEVPDGAITVFSAHGVSPAMRRAAAARGLRVVDAAWPLTARVHAKARRFA